MFTVNPAFPHPDSDHEPQPMPLDEAILWAIQTLQDPTASQWQRQKAADELTYSFETQDDSNEQQVSAAAPDLLAALRQLVEAATHHEADAPAALKAARAAILKATP